MKTRTKVSVVIPTQNRPELLLQALRSVSLQTYPAWEIVIIDDASTPPVDLSAIQGEFSETVRLIRNDKPLNVLSARRQGVEAATGEFCIHLDDDDLLAPEAIEMALFAFREDPDLDVIFLGTKGFGMFSTGFDERQSRNIDKLLSVTKSEENQHIIFFENNIFHALLKGVPMAFQRSMERCQVWLQLDEIRTNITWDSGVEKKTCHHNSVDALWNESEWALYAAALTKTALLTRPVYLQRCDGQGYFSHGEVSEAAVQAGLRNIGRLYVASETIDDLKPKRTEILAQLAYNYFSYAYFLFQRGRRQQAYVKLYRAFVLLPRFHHLRLALRMLLPSGSAYHPISIREVCLLFLDKIRHRVVGHGKD